MYGGADVGPRWKMQARGRNEHEFAVDGDRNQGLAKCESLRDDGSGDSVRLLADVLSGCLSRGSVCSNASVGCAPVGRNLSKESSHEAASQTEFERADRTFASPSGQANHGPVPSGEPSGQCFGQQ